ncbi:MAG TPA: hypothetical protein VHX65_08150 [Pirellulales bacterium]|nr:hypothetical protein [Pirellulales bacterium]
MDADELIELAAALSAEGPVLFAVPGAISAGGLAGYWAASKCRQQRWTARLKSFRLRLIGGSADATRRAARADAISPDATSAAARSCWRAALPVCREVLASEILTRVCAGFCAVFDRRRGSREAEPLARSVWIGHQEARRSVLSLLAAGNGLPDAEAKRLDHLRRTAERWSDRLLAPLAALGELSDLAHDSARLADFAEDAIDDRVRDAAEGSAHIVGDTARQLWSRSRREAFASCRRLATFNADLNAQIAASLLSCFNLEGLDEMLAPRLSAFSRSLLCQRLSTIAADAQSWIAGLLAPDAAAAEG